MLDTSSPDLPDAFRTLSQHRPRPLAPIHAARRSPGTRRMRARRTAMIMVAFGIVLGCVEIIILLSYL